MGLGLLLLFILLVSDISAVDIKDCEGLDATTALTLDISGCSNGQLCEVKKGSSITVTCKFEPFQNAEKWTDSLVIVEGTDTTTLIPEGDTCQLIRCPINKNKLVKLVANLTSSNDGPDGEKRLQIRISDTSTKELLFCSEFTVKFI